MIKVFLFAHLQERAGRQEVTIDKGELTVKELKERLMDEYHLPLDGVMIAVNEQYSLEDEVISSGDAVALIPPVSGG
ncbi:MULTISPECIES: MoaD/ThiS family protein [Rossellomorea]|uniref:MoaD/ThiS family protein n=1 Tax=Rossellomorea TaxID=2837508 RepID=UPI001CCE8C8D|nr:MULTISPECIES: MoaD/ThiS family protein [Rossellomorea]MCA0150981.1 MoaD/ThiS family protein [Rossellomorea vietnamensis]UTE76914.1 MoaD/ThiS family protein [Rossellomorea sp. KS-H15a]WGG44828.1 MoaD/ThiS family protein [Rossellomorea sp. DA94]